MAVKTDVLLKTSRLCRATVTCPFCGSHTDALAYRMYHSTCFVHLYPIIACGYIVSAYEMARTCADADVPTGRYSCPYGFSGDSYIMAHACASKTHHLV